jgi:hypothetical protein
LEEWTSSIIVLVKVTAEESVGRAAEGLRDPHGAEVAAAAVVVEEEAIEVVSSTTQRHTEARLCSSSVFGKDFFFFAFFFCFEFLRGGTSLVPVLEYFPVEREVALLIII